MRRALIGLALAAAACQADTPKFARARVVESLDQAIGGPTANATVGDYILENDQIRAVIEQGHLSFLPTDVGGTLIDLDLQRAEPALRGGRGLDQLGQIAPMANLSLPGATAAVHVRITGTPTGAEVTTAAEARPFIRILLALSLLVDQHFAQKPTTQNIYTEYEVRPGERLLRIRTTVGVNVPFCRATPEDGCNEQCDDILYDKDCVCPVIPARCRTGVERVEATPLPDREPATLLDLLLGDLPRPLDSGTCQTSADCDLGAGEICVPVTTSLGGALSVCRGPDNRDAGLFLGDLLVFGGELTPFVRGIGYDTETDIRRLFDQGKDTLSSPLVVDAVFATGAKVSLGYQSANGKILVPIFRGPFSLGTTHAATCTTDSPACLEAKLITFERWISVGEGDVASAQEPLLRAAGTPVGTVQGVVTQVPDGTPRSGIDVYALRDPRSLACDADCQARCGAVPAPATWTLEVVRTANRCRTRELQYPDGTSAIESFAKTDPGTDRILDGRFELALPAGDYVLIALDAHRARSGLLPVTVTAGQTTGASLSLPEPGVLEYAIYDETAHPGPVRVTITRPDGALLPLELGGLRPADGIVYVEDSATGRGRIQLPTGTYDVHFTRGPHYSLVKQTLSVSPRVVTRTTGALTRLVARRGWISAGFHVHAGESMDSGLAMRDRITSFLAEDIDLLNATDHDSITDYEPTVKEMGVSDRIDTMIGAEITTQEYGHYVAYPLPRRQWQNGQRLPGNGAVQWRNKSPLEIMRAARELGPDVIINVPHPYDYFDQYRVDPVTLEPSDSLLALINPFLGATQFTGDYDVTELFNTKNYHRVRRATIAETAYYARGLDALIAQVDAGEIDVATYTQRWFELSAEATRQRLHRTVAEQDAALDGTGAELLCLCGGDGDCGAGQVCERSTASCVPSPGSAEPAPPSTFTCRTSRGVIDDWFMMLNRGVYRPGIAGDDVHSREAGYVRTMVYTDGTSPPFLEGTDVVRALTDGKSMVTNGPMVHFTIDGAMVGETVSAAPGTPVALSVRVEKAPWYDVDRLELYRNGRLIAWANGCAGGRGADDEDADTLPCLVEGDAIVAWDEVLDDVPPGDAWYAVVVYGLDGRSMAPIYESQVLAEIGTPEITQRLFTVIPGLQEFKYPRAPTIYPVFPFAFTNPIWVDVGGDGWLPPLAPPSWCQSRDAGCPR